MIYHLIKLLDGSPVVFKTVSMILDNRSNRKSKMKAISACVTVLFNFVMTFPCFDVVDSFSKCMSGTVFEGSALLNFCLKSFHFDVTCWQGVFLSCVHSQL